MKLYTWDADFGRDGRLSGMFVLDDYINEKYYGKSITLFDVLGKHSEIVYEFREEDFMLLSENEKEFDWLYHKVGGRTICGINPFESNSLVDDDISDSEHYYDAYHSLRD